MDELQEGEVFSWTWFPLSVLTETGGPLVVCIADDGSGYGTIVDGATPNSKICSNGSWITEHDFDWYSGETITNCNGIEDPIFACEYEGQIIIDPGVTFVGGIPEEFLSYNSLPDESGEPYGEGICCPTGFYPDCTGECYRLDDAAFESPDECLNCPSQGLVVGTPFCIGVENPTEQEIIDAQNNPYNCCDCSGDPFGNLVIDACGTCGGGILDEANCYQAQPDCSGVLDGDAVIDTCDLCVCPEGSESQIAGGDCFVITPNATKDSCGICHPYSQIFDSNGNLQTDWNDGGNWYVDADPSDPDVLAGEGPLWNCGENNVDCPAVYKMTQTI
jgi:hypothetical protein